MNPELLKDYLDNVINSGDDTSFLELLEVIKASFNNERISFKVDNESVVVARDNVEEILLENIDGDMEEEDSESRKRRRTEDSSVSERVTKKMKKAESRVKKLDEAHELEGEKLDWRACDLNQSSGRIVPVRYPTNLKYLIQKALTYYSTSEMYNINYYMLCLRSYMLYDTMNLTQVTFSNEMSENEEEYKKYYECIVVGENQLYLQKI
ncbi:hypothetical protein BDB01DRAFT_855431 [Pilobolus umbonatus]|nr:hypothetical protein BDB01DRAFT_855431 [Pilobolus umbonatus]